MIKKILMALLLIAPMSLSAQKFASFTYSEVMQALPDFRTAQTELQAIGQKYENDLTEMQKEIQTKYEKYQQEVNETTPANIRERREQEIIDLRTRYEQAQSDNQKAFTAAQQQKMQPIIQKVMTAVNEVAKAGGYVYIVDKSASQSAGIFLNDALNEDVTKKIMDKLGITAADIAAGKAAAAKLQQEAAAAAK